MAIEDADYEIRNNREWLQTLEFDFSEITFQRHYLSHTQEWNDRKEQWAHHSKLANSSLRYALKKKLEAVQLKRLIITLPNHLMVVKINIQKWFKFFL